jgi:hypothetical protein
VDLLASRRPNRASVAWRGTSHRFLIFVAGRVRGTLEALRKHASLADLPADEIIPVADTVIVRDDP